ncbi:MAG TPA: HD domain-containing phosphohydrolase [Pyrinomonadaceae bacterium]|jgi:putative nucleotidyltransferase with HDIG domain|nr:HD domain-containing phosphohydrolase [Pyrinomonadaceae bacterium]
MSTAAESNRARVFRASVTAAGLLVWAAAAAEIAATRTALVQLELLALVPLAIIVGVFPITFPLPSGLNFTREKICFTLSDALILLVGLRHGPLPAVFLAGLEGFVSSRSSVKRLSSNFFSSSMMSLAAGGAAAALAAVLAYGFGSDALTFTAVAVALLAASVVQLAVNIGLLSTLLALRHGDPILSVWRKNFLWAASMFLPTSTAASLMYLALQTGLLVVLVVGAPVLLTVYFVHRQYRDSARSELRARETAHRQTVEALAVAINAKDEVTHEHVQRVQTYAAGVARLLGCDEAEVEALKAGALLHDIGKIAVPDYILHKPGKLTAEEFNRMKLHTVIGAQILSRVEFPFPVVPVVRHHHERWDGRGYPDALSGEEIPLTARILSVVDCFDAVREDRQYRRGMTRDEAINFILKGSGSQYDPNVVATFLAHLPEFEAEIERLRGAPVPTFGIEQAEELSAAALGVAPAAGLAEEKAAPLALTAEERASLDSLAFKLGDGAAGRDAAEIFFEELAALVPFETGALVRVEPETGESRVAHAAGRDASLLAGREVPPGAGVTGWVLVNRQPLANTDPRLDFPEDLARHFDGYRTLASFPLLRGKELLGAVTLYSSSLAQYDERQQLLLRESTAALAHALDRPLPPPPVAAKLESELTH